MENNLKESFLRSKDPKEEKYLPFVDLEYDYEINKHYYCNSIKNEKRSLSNKSSSIEKVSETFSEKDSELDFNEILNKIHSNNNDRFNDQLAPRYFRSEEVAFYKKNHFKALVSNKRIRLINKEFDLDLV